MRFQVKKGSNLQMARWKDNYMKKTISSEPCLSGLIIPDQQAQCREGTKL